MLRQQKEILRHAALARRAALTPEMQQAAALGFMDTFLDNLSLKKNSIVAAYWPVQDELDVMPLMRRLLDKGFICAMPQVVKLHAPLIFRRWDEETIMADGPYKKLKEPDAAHAEVVQPAVVIVPTLAFDPSGHRLGHGTGYYDVTFDRMKKDHRRFITIGAAYEQQCFDVVPVEAHDAHLDIIVTDQKIYKIRNVL